jgi:hypothetical protein
MYATIRRICMLRFLAYEKYTLISMGTETVAVAKTMEAKSRITLNSSKRQSLRTTIPSVIVQALGLENHDTLIWAWTIKNNKVNVEIKKA